jgi:hypothetical protein
LDALSEVSADPRNSVETDPFFPHPAPEVAADVNVPRTSKKHEDELAAPVL